MSIELGYSLSRLKTRQHEVLACVMAGDANHQIAAYLDLSLSSVNKYVAQLKKVIGAQRREDMIDICFT